MGTMTKDEAHRIYEGAGGNIDDDDEAHMVGLLAVANAAAERAREEGRREEWERARLMGPVVAAARRLLREAPDDTKARDALRSALDAYTDAALRVDIDETAKGGPR